jgi:hypothetical protein
MSRRKKEESAQAGNTFQLTLAGLIIFSLALIAGVWTRPVLLGERRPVAQKRGTQRRADCGRSVEIKFNHQDARNAKTIQILMAGIRKEGFLPFHLSNSILAALAAWR